MNLLKILAISHAYQQLVYKWYPVHERLEETLHINKGSGTDELFLMTVEDWLNAIKSSEELLLYLFDGFESFRDPLSTLSVRIANALFLHFKHMKESNAQPVFYGDRTYPLRLKAISDPPLMLCVKGSLDLLSKDMVGVIGSRKASRRALQVAFDLGALLGKSKVVVSGGAFGCDINAHRGVLSLGISPAPLVVVFAGGLYDLYPQGNLSVFRKIIQQQGIFLSERLWFAVSRPFDFPVRNRIISGLSDSIYVPQAQIKSGALITARMALDQGRDVFVWDAYNEDNKCFSGNHKLIEEGARAFERLSL